MSFTIPLNLVIVAILCWLSALSVGARINPQRFLSYVVIVVIGGVSLLMSGGPSSEFLGSVASWVVVVVLYVILFIETPCGLRLGQRYFEGARVAILLGACLAVAQFVIQNQTSLYFDPVDLFPDQFKLPGFNSHYAVFMQDGSGVISGIKPNGIIFLEPSFLSLYCGIGLSYELVLFVERSPDRGKSILVRTGRPLLLFLGAAVSASASGILVLVLAMVYAIFIYRRQLSRMLQIGLSAALLGFVGVFDLVLGKATEGVEGGTSTALRLVMPYQLLPPFVLERPLLGWSPGGASYVVDSIGVQGLQAPTPLKMALDYGIPATLLMVIVVWAILKHSTAPRVLIVAIVGAWLIPAEALLNPALASLALFCLGQWHGYEQSKEDVSTGHSDSPDDVEIAKKDVKS